MKMKLSFVLVLSGVSFSMYSMGEIGSMAGGGTVEVKNDTNLPVWFRTQRSNMAVKVSPKAMRAFQQYNGPIVRITFFRIKGFEKITGSPKYLLKKLKALRGIVGSYLIYLDPHLKWSGRKPDLWNYTSRIPGGGTRQLITFDVRKKEKVTIEVPIIEHFDYQLNKKIGVFGAGEVVLKSWGNAVQTDPKIFKEKMRARKKEQRQQKRTERKKK